MGPGWADDPIEGLVMGLARHSLDRPLLIEGQSPAGNAQGKLGEQAIVIAAAATEAVAVVIEQQPRHKTTVDRVGCELVAIERGFP